MVRVDQAGEYGATRIYAGQLAVMGDRTPMARDDRRHGKPGRAPPRLFRRDDARAAACARLRSSPFWNVAGFALGAVTAAMGPEAAMACTAAIETEIDRALPASARGARRQRSRACRRRRRSSATRKLEHRETALAHGAEHAPAYPLLSGLIRAGRRAAIAISKTGYKGPAFSRFGPGTAHTGVSRMLNWISDRSRARRHPDAAARRRARPECGAERRALVIYGKDKCPTNSNGEEIVVCKRLDERERYRIPSNLREEAGPPQKTESWAVRSQDALTPAISAPAAARPLARVAAPATSSAGRRSRAPRHGRARRPKRICRCPDRFSRAPASAHPFGRRAAHAIDDDPQHHHRARRRGAGDVDAACRRPGAVHPGEEPEFGEIGEDPGRGEQRHRP